MLVFIIYSTVKTAEIQQKNRQNWWVELSKLSEVSPVPSVKVSQFNNHTYFPTISETLINHLRTIRKYTATLKKMHPFTKPLETCTKTQSIKNRHNTLC